ncbi:hypothetical protein A2V80_00045, partial [Candidatus Woesebacteria bacterium RBG_16_39_8b]
TVWEIADFFGKHFYNSMDKLNVLRPTTIAKATEHIGEQIELVGKLVEKGFAYDTPEALYFDIEKFADYSKLFGQKVTEKKVGVRKEVKGGEHKKHPYDFALWFKTVGRFANHTMHWESPWGVGFPGWHIECSAMSLKYLGNCFDPFGKLRVNGEQCRTIDIHTGGEDHLSVHHPNEIAQSEAATGKKPFVKYWIHHAFLMVNGKKMSKSLGNLNTVEDVQNKGFEIPSLRYLYLTAHYRNPLNFTWEALASAESAYFKLKEMIVSAKSTKGRVVLSEDKKDKVDKYNYDFISSINDDLNTPRALAVLWEVIKSNIPSEDKYDLAMSFDEVLGLELGKVSKAKSIPKVSKEVKMLIDEREKLRKENKFKEADEVRKEIEKKGYKVEDSSKGPMVRKTRPENKNIRN